MDIDKQRCINWTKNLIQLIRENEQLNIKEKKYIKAIASIALGIADLNELEATNESKTNK